MIKKSFENPSIAGHCVLRMRMIAIIHTNGDNKCMSIKQIHGYTGKLIILDDAVDVDHTIP